MSVVRPRRPTPPLQTPPLQLLKIRVDRIVEEQDEMKANITSELEKMKKNIKYLEGKLDDLIDIYREHFHANHAKSSTNKGK